MARMSSNANFLGGTLAIEVEIRKEKTSALRRVATRVESLLEELKQVEQCLAGTRGPERARWVARHKELRAEADKQRWYLIVQREAMGLFHHDDVYEMYRLPAPVE
ncbi:hypothetical protein ACN28S_40505 [Cystobacter fuscus]